MYGKFQSFLQKELADIESAGLYKKERVITTPQKADIRVNGDRHVVRSFHLWHAGYAQTT